MKTIKQAAKEAVSRTYPMGDNDSPTWVGFVAGFKQGAEFVQQWIPIWEKLPVCYETGVWDGKRSEFVLVKFKDGNWTKARLYSGILDGHMYEDWYNENDFEVKNITHWRPIELI